MKLRSLREALRKKGRAAALLLAVLITVSAPMSVFAASGSSSSSASSASTASAVQVSAPPSMPGGSSPGGGQGNGAAPGGGANTQTYDFTGSHSASLTAGSGKTVKKTSGTITAASKDQNAALAQNGGTLDLSGVTLSKSGSDEDGDSCNFYGLNSILLAVGKSSKAYLSNSSLTASGSGSNGLFATDSAKIFANDLTISTEKDNSRGLDATYGGTIVANALKISTKGSHSAALATDRGGGNISVTDSSLKTAGSGSPLLYSTGTIEVNGVQGTASGSQIAGMEGYNTIRIKSSTLTSTNDAKTGSDPIKNGVIIYQSTSGDADTESSQKADFEAEASTLKTSITSGAMFYVTNTTAKVVLKDTKIQTGSSAVDLIRAEGNNSNNWGTAGSNGAKLTFTGISQDLSGNIVVDTISSLKFYLLDGSTYTGSTKIEQNTAGSSSGSPLSMYLSKDSTWTVTSSCQVSNLYAESGAKIVDKSGKTVTIVAGGKTVVKGTSSLKVTVTGKYGTSFETGSDNKLSSMSISRKAFNSHFGLNTSTEKLSSSSSASASSTASTANTSTKSASASSSSGSIFARIWAWLRSLLS